jgi:hypothetical protein
MSAETTKLEGYDFITINQQIYQIEPTGRESGNDMKAPGHVVDTFNVENENCDFAHATILPNQTTPIQLVNRTGIIDYPIHGTFTILIWRDNKLHELEFDENRPETHSTRGEYQPGDIICCVSTNNNSGEFIEQCTPAYNSGDFTNLSENTWSIPSKFLRRIQHLKNT